MGAGGWGLVPRCQLGGRGGGRGGKGGGGEVSEQVRFVGGRLMGRVGKRGGGQRGGVR